MARPRSVEDDDLLEATAHVVERRGPIAFTLAEVAREAGVTAPVLVQRFGSKRDLLLAVSRRAARRTEAEFERAAARHASPLEALHATLAALAAPVTPRAIASGLAFLQLDVTDPAFRKEALAWFEAFHAGVVRLLVAAGEARELKHVDAEALARAIEVAYNGSLLTWALRQEGEGEAALRRDVEAVLAPFRKR